MIIQDEKEIRSGFWTKRRPILLILLVCLEVLNFNFGPQFWYIRGLQYKDRGWTEAARIFFQFAAWSNPWSETGQMAESYMKIRLPINKIPPAIQEKNIDAFNLDALGNTDRAIAAFEALIKERPDFEWPYNNLANIKIDLGQLKEAEKLSTQALKINPYYANAHITLARSLKRQKRDKEAKEHLDEAKTLLKTIHEEDSATYY